MATEELYEVSPGQITETVAMNALPFFSIITINALSLVLSWTASRIRDSISCTVAVGLLAVASCFVAPTRCFLSTCIIIILLLLLLFVAAAL